MMTLILVGSLLVLGIGLIAKFVLDKKESDLRITWTEYAIASGVMLAIVIPLTSWIGTKLAFQNTVTYHESWNGYEVSVTRDEIKCTRDGPCRHEYDCDPYTVRESYDCSYYTGSGKDRRRVSKTCYRNVTKYHDCPYTDYEYTYRIHTTIGDYTIAEHWLPENPESHRYRTFKSVPDHLPSGVPAFWESCRLRLAANKPGPVTKRADYENYILASQHTILKKYSADIERYKKDGLLPKVNPNIQDIYYADRVYFAGVPHVSNAGNWQRTMGYFNGAMGLELQADMHLVIVDANRVSNPDNYIGALTAYWQGPEFEKNALSKNGVVVVLGTKDGKTVEWSRALTGMPQGNEELLIEIRDKLAGTALTPEAVLGPPTGIVTGGTVQIVHANGALEKLVWGPHQFKRIRMREYDYLKHEIEPTSSQKFWIYFVTVLFGCIAWGICIKVGPSVGGRFRRDL